jgi:Ca-activated chloride channel family protein
MDINTLEQWSLEYPWVWFLLPLPWFIRQLLPKAKRIQTPLFVPFFEQARTINRHSSQPHWQSKNRWIPWVMFCIWCLLLLAASRPIWLGAPIQNPHSGRDLMLAVDISRSMETMDLTWANQAVTRLGVVKGVVSDFVERRRSDRLGLILFADHAYVQSPLTFDRETLKQLLLEAQIGFAGRNTAIGEAIGVGIKRLKNRPENNRVLILLTDGANTAGEISPRQAADLAKTAGIKVYAIGMGADRIARSTLFGTEYINPSKDLDEETLKYIASTTGGRYFRAKSTADLDAIYRQLDELEPIDIDVPQYRPIHQWFYWPLALAWLLSFILALHTLLPSFRLFQRSRT